jgi:hypothetical protein
MVKQGAIKKGGGQTGEDSYRAGAIEEFQTSGQTGGQIAGQTGI